MAGVAPQVLDAVSHRVALGCPERAARPAVDVARQLLDPPRAHGDPEVLRRDVLELVRFVEHRMPAFGDDGAVAAAPYRRIGEEQMMVDDDDVRLLGPAAHARHEALVVARTLASKAGLGARRDVVPERQIFGQIVDLGAISRFRPGGPFVDDREEHPRVVGGGKSRQGAGHPSAFELIVERGIPVQAQIVPAALHARRLERDAERPFEHGQVFEIHLLLKVLGARGDEHPLALQDGWHEVGECLAGARACFGEQHAPTFERRRDSGRHRALPGAGLEPVDCGRNRTVRGERPVDGLGE